MPGKNILTDGECPTAFAGNSPLLVIDRSVSRSCGSGQRERRGLMIIQPDRESRNVNELFYEYEARRIAELNEIFGEVELTAAEKRTLIWLAGWEESTVANVISAVRKAMEAEAKRQELPPARRAEKPPAGRKGSF